jgi:hypothetical protein
MSSGRQRIQLAVRSALHPPGLEHKIAALNKTLRRQYFRDYFATFVIPSDRAAGRKQSNSISLAQFLSVRGKRPCGGYGAAKKRDEIAPPRVLPLTLTIRCTD